MVIEALVFYVFAAVAILCGVMVITARNPVHSVLYLILAFFNAAALFVLQGAEFLAMLLVIVYVGAVAVLFLFVVMMMDVDIKRLRSGAVRYMGIGMTLGSILLVEVLFAVGAWHFSGEKLGIPEKISAAPDPAVTHNTEALGNLIYTDYVYLFQGAGLVLLVAMVGAIVLTLREREGVKRQRIAKQVAKPASEEVKVVKVQTGGGI